METIHALTDFLGSFTPAQYCQTYYLFAAGVILSVNVLPRELQSALLDYGARQQKPNDTRGTDSNTWIKKTLTSLLSCVEVPHSWFLHFYVLSVAGSAFWAWQYVTRGAIMEAMAQAQVKDGSRSVEISSVFVAWALMAVQGLRRLYESLVIMKAGKSLMSSVHWIVGLAYYACMSVSVWVEGSGAILESWTTSQAPSLPSTRAILGVVLFIFASFKQNECHKHLSGLKKYTLPHQGWFQHIICPHYTSECLIYVALSLVASPPDTVVNRTVFTGLLFVAVNLGTTASTTNKWYAEKFGAEKVASRWKMIPFVF